MGLVVICRKLPCVFHPRLHEAVPWWEPATPFLVGVLILLVSIGTTRAVAEKAEERMTKGWTTEMLREAGIDPKKSPYTHVLALAWVIDVSQIPALLGTPLAGLFILDHRIVLLPYTAVLAAGLIVYFGFYLMKDINGYETLGREYRGYRFSLITCGAILLNLVCALIAILR